MGPKTIVSYDDTLNDHDALALSRVFATVGAELELAYVRHITQSDRSREELDQSQAEELLERVARWLDDLDVPRKVVVSASTGEGLACARGSKRVPETTRATYQAGVDADRFGSRC